jgi:hypothetical protein
MAVFYPDRKTILIAIVCIIVVGGTYIYVERQQNQSGYSQTEAATAENGPSAVSALSGTTSDIVSYDWKKQFISSSTGAFTAVGANAAQRSASDQPLTFTAQFGRDFFTKYALLQQNNLENDDVAVKNLINQSMTEFIAGAPQPKTYTTSDIASTKESGDAADRIYANAVGALFSMYAPRDNAAIIAGDALDQKDPKGAEKIDPVIVGYQTVLKKLLTLPVPGALAQYHLGIVNGVSSMLFVTEGMRQVFSDPAQSMVALGMYGTAQDALRQPITELTGYLREQGITFSGSEPAVVLLSIE